MSHEIDEIDVTSASSEVNREREYKSNHESVLLCSLVGFLC